MVRLLELYGHQVWAAHDGPTAIELARSHHPRFILLDIGLPGLDGYQVARQLRRERCGKDAVIIAVSGYGQAGDRRRSSEAGFDHHLVKPIEPEALVALIRNHGTAGSDRGSSTATEHADAGGRPPGD
jgi:CheY-like chemotaxis protein